MYFHNEFSDYFDSFINLVTIQKLINDQHEFKDLLQLINNISNNHQRIPKFISKLERVLRQFKQDIINIFQIQKFSNFFLEQQANPSISS